MKKSDRQKYSKGLIPYGRLCGTGGQHGDFRIFHEYEGHTEDAWYGDTLVVRSWGVLMWNERGKFWQQVGKYYAKYGNALKFMLQLAN